MFGGGNRPSKEDLEAQNQQTNQVVYTSIFIATALWITPYAIHFVKEKF